MSRIRARLGRSARNAATGVRRLVQRTADDVLAVAGVACLAVAAGFASPALAWAVVGVFLLASATAGKRRAP